MNKSKLLATSFLVWIYLFLPNGIGLAQEKTVTFIKEVSNDNATIELFDTELDKIWKPTFKYAIVISPKTTLKEYSKALCCIEKKDNKFNRDNTLVICQKGDRERAEEVAPGFTRYISDPIPPADRKEIFFYLIKNAKNEQLNYHLERFDPSDESR